jgi:hypothetical protein
MRSSTFIQWSGLAALFGGLLSILFAYFYVFTHGSTQHNRDATLLGLTSTQYARLAVIWPLLILVGLMGLHARHSRRAERLERTGFIIAFIGTIILAVSYVLQVWIVDPDQHFYSLPVQVGWLLQLLAYPVHATGMVVLGIATLRAKVLPRWRSLPLMIGVLTLPSLLLPFFVSAISSGTLLWDVMYGAFSLPYGLSWALLGYVLWSEKGEGVR